MQVLRQEAGSLIYANSSGSTISAGDVIDLTDRVGVVAQDIADGESGTVFTAGVFRLPKDTTTFAQGGDVDWDDSESKCSDVGNGDSGDILHIGKCHKAAATGDSYVDVEINAGVTAELVP